MLLSSAVVSKLLYLSGKLSAESLFACYGQRLGPGLNVVHFNWVCALVFL